jgi:membrane-associated phospholipid phosphatase
MRNTRKNLKVGLNKLKFQAHSYETQMGAPSIYWAREIDLWKIIKGCWKSRYGSIHFRLMDINCLAYLGITGFLLVFFHNTVSHWGLHFWSHTVICIAVLEMVRWAEKYPSNKILWVLRTFYPVLIFLCAWEELGTLLTMFYGSYWFTDTLVRLDKLIFGVHPTVWIQQFYQPWLSELMNFFYIGYFVLFLLVPLSLLVKKKKEAAFTIISITTFVYFSNFCLFFLLPAFSPPFIPMLRELHTNQQAGYFFVVINRIVQTNGGIPGGCFPSSHVAGAFAWALCALRYNRKLGFALIPIAVGVAFATVYNTVHHAVDPIAGFVWGIFTFTIALKLVKNRGEDPLTASGNSTENSL